MDLFITNKDDITKIDELDIINAYEVKDKNHKRLIYAPFHNKTSEKKFYVESNLLKVKVNNIKGNYITVEPNFIALQIFKKIDEKCVNLLQNLCDYDGEFIDIPQNNITDSINDDKLVFIPIIDDKDLMKVRFDKNTIMKSKGKEITINDISIGDSVILLILVDCLSIYPDEKCAYIRLNIAHMDVKKEIVINEYNPILNHKFFCSNHYSEIVLDNYDLSYVNTEKFNKNNDDNEQYPIVNIPQTINENDGFSDYNNNDKPYNNNNKNITTDCFANNDTSNYDYEQTTDMKIVTETIIPAKKPRKPRMKKDKNK